MAAEDVPRVVVVITTLLERLTERNDAASGPGTELVPSPFRATVKPYISVRAYMARIARFAYCSPSCFVMAYIYLDRLLHRRPALVVDSCTVHRLLIAAVLAAVKFMDARCYKNVYFARVGWISLLEMNRLERHFLFGVTFDLNVSPEVFDRYCDNLRSEMLCLELERLSLTLPEDEDDGSPRSQQQRLDL